MNFRKLSRSVPELRVIAGHRSPCFCVSSLLTFLLLSFLGHAMYKEQAVREPTLSRLKEIATGLGLDVEETELQEYQSMSSKVPLNES